MLVHCAANVEEPVQQGMWGMFEVFADTMVVCTLTALVVLTDAVFRIGGDEFALIVNGAVTEGFCKSRVEKIKAAIREPYRLKDAEVQVGTSCGCAVYPCDSDDVRAIRILADHRMYEDKQRSGRSCE